MHACYFLFLYVLLSPLLLVGTDQPCPDDGAQNVKEGLWFRLMVEGLTVVTRRGKATSSQVLPPPADTGLPLLTCKVGPLPLSFDLNLCPWPQFFWGVWAYFGHSPPKFSTWENLAILTWLATLNVPTWPFSM